MDGVVDEVMRVEENIYKGFEVDEKLRTTFALTLTLFACFEEHRQKHRRQCFFKNITTLRKKHNVLHDVLGFRNSTRSYEKSLVT